MAEAEDKPKRLSLSTSILIGASLGLLCGLFFGEYCAFLGVFGEAFIKLLQMAILPYIVVSLITGIGSLDYGQARRLASRGGAVLLLLWGLGLGVILLMSLALPTLQSASFFSTTLVDPGQPVDLLDLWIPSNPFSSLANSVVPAVVLFSIALGIALIALEDKATFLQPLSVLSKALVRITQFVVRLTPAGVFAVVASAAGTMSFQELERLQAYFILFIAAAIVLTFWILPVLVSALTPFSYRDLVGVSRDALVTGFATGNLFIVLPVLSEGCKGLLEKYQAKGEQTDQQVDVMVPIAFNFPHLGKLLSLLFVLFGAWFSDTQLAGLEYLTFAVSGLISMFGSVTVSIPYLLDMYQIPSDLFQLFMISGVLNSRFATLLAVMHLSSLTLLTASALGGLLSFRVNRVAGCTLATLVLLGLVIVSTRMYLGQALQGAYRGDELITNMQLLNASPAVVHRQAPPGPVSEAAGRTVLEGIRESGTLRVGYRPDNLPFSYFNAEDELVGFDIDMAHLLAGELNCQLELFPVELESVADRLEKRQVDIVMSGVGITTPRLERMGFSNPYMEVVLALVVRDHRRKEFATLDGIFSREDLRIGVVSYDYFASKVQDQAPGIEVVQVASIRDFFENKGDDLDALLTNAEAASAWTLLYPQFAVVVPQPEVVAQPLAYPLRKHDTEMERFVSHWIDLKKGSLQFQQLYQHWILGQTSQQEEPRWSIIRSVLHWVD